MSAKGLIALTPSQLIGAYLTAYMLANPRRREIPDITYSGGYFHIGPKRYRKSTMVSMTEAWFAQTHPEKR